MSEFHSNRFTAVEIDPGRRYCENEGKINWKWQNYLNIFMTTRLEVIGVDSKGPLFCNNNEIEFLSRRAGK